MFMWGLERRVVVYNRKYVRGDEDVMEVAFIVCDFEAFLEGLVP